MHDDSDIAPYDAHERALFAALPRESELPPGEQDRLVAGLAAEGFFRKASPRRVGRWALEIAAAIVLLAVGGVAGARIAIRNTIEAQLARHDLGLEDRVLLLQRAGSAYVQAAHAYANATAHVDSMAVQVASRVLIGAAHAVARSDLDGGISSGLTAVLQTASHGHAVAPKPTKPVIWF